MLQILMKVWMVQKIVQNAKKISTVLRLPWLTHHLSQLTFLAKMVTSVLLVSRQQLVLPSAQPTATVLQVSRHLAPLVSTHSSVV